MKSAAKTAHLTALEGAKERLKLFEADLLKAGSFDEAVAGCDTVIHTASPFFNGSDPDQLVKPAVEGTTNVLAACKKAGVKVFVCTSSTAAVFGKKGGVPEGHIFTEDDWADAD